MRIREAMSDEQALLKCADAPASIRFVMLGMMEWQWRGAHACYDAA